MDADSRQYQGQLHKMTQDRISALDAKLDLILASASRMETVCEEFPKLADRVSSLEKQREFNRGFLLAISLAGGFVGNWAAAAIAWVFHHLNTK